MFMTQVGKKKKQHNNNKQKMQIVILQRNMQKTVGPKDFAMVNNYWLLQSADTGDSVHECIITENITISTIVCFFC